MAMVLVGVVVAATNWFSRFVHAASRLRNQTSKPVRTALIAPEAITNSLLISASLALQSVSTSAVAESAPERGVISFKYLDYQDWQGKNVDTSTFASSSSARNRIKVKAQALQVAVPIQGEWLVSGTYTADAISGATPKYDDRYLSRMSDHRDALNLSVRRYFHRGTLTLGANVSSENDYLSRGFSLSGTVDSETKNTSLNLGLSVSNDDINPTGNRLPFVEQKHSMDWLVGITQVMTVDDVLQVNVGFSDSQGYLSDPYKSADNRPRQKQHYTLSTRWNHYFEKLNGVGHLGYRYYTDTFGVHSHTLSVDYDQGLSHGWTVSPILRLYTQNAADFYYGPNEVPGPDVRYTSSDQRLSTYGALTWGVKLVKQINKDWDVDFKFEKYRQQQNWSLSDHTSGELQPFSYRAIQLGISRKF